MLRFFRNSTSPLPVNSMLTVYPTEFLLIGKLAENNETLDLVLENCHSYFPSKEVYEPDSFFLQLK